MQTMIIILLTIIIFISIIAMLYIILYNKIQFSKIRTEQAESVILDELQKRYDLIKKCESAIEKNTKMDLTLFSDLERIKNSNTSSYDFERKITEAVSTIYLIKNDYPKIEEKKDFREIIRKLNESDTKISAAKSYYNKHNKELTTLTKSFPSNIISLIHRIKSQPFYDAVEIFNETDDGIEI
ncbi:MAG: LemA family protein [Erysipelotrichales bacterium]|nr:LemA family protein [Erysipelotrichales bacterium]